MKRVPVIARTKPLIAGLPTIISLDKSGNFEHITFPKFLFKAQNYFAIEVLPRDLIDENENWAIAGDSHVVMAFLLSSFFPIWVRGVTGKKETKTDFKTSYNTFPFPDFTKRQEEKLMEGVSAVYKARGTSSGKILSDIYCSGDIPDHLEMAHEDLDEVVLDIFGLPHDASNEVILEKLFEKYREHI